jgi:RecJ-like exonuclease
MKNGETAHKENRMEHEQHKCAACGGTGDCPDCKGTSNGGQCERCAGTGRCSNCQGTGRKPEKLAG